MSDVLTKAQRKRCMSKIRACDTKPELVVRKGLFRRGYRYRVGHSGLPGNPDMVFAKYHAVIFIHGCFWHGHDCHLFKWPSNNAAFWRLKITKNVSRDHEVHAQLLQLGWRVFVVWECAMKGREKYDVEILADHCENWLCSVDEQGYFPNKTARVS